MAHRDEKDETEINKDIVDHGPPPDIKRRRLIFDSLRTITDANDQNGGASPDSTGGTYVYSWGAGYHGQLGRKFTRGQKKYASAPQIVEFPETLAIRQVACGGLHTAAVTDSGKVYTWGDGRLGQLGQTTEGFVNQSRPRAVPGLNAAAVQVACGQGHTIVLSDRGKLYSWGSSKFGQTGHGDRQNVKFPKAIETERALVFTQIECGDKHTVALTRTGQVYTFGCGLNGQLGHGDQQDQLRPTQVTSLLSTRLHQTSCGSIFTAFISETGELYVCGFSEYFYPHTENNFVYQPRKLAMKDRIAQVACGQAHIVVRTNKGDVYSWGAGEYGQLGQGVQSNLSAPRLIFDQKDVVQVAAGRYHSMALTNHGVAYSWGNNDNGQLGQDTDANLPLPRVIEHLVGAVVGQIACGEHHSIALTSVKWSKCSQEMQDWVSGKRQEMALKFKYVKQTNYGLGKKELTKIREEKALWEQQRDQQRAETKREEQADTRRQVKSISNRRTLSIEIQKSMIEQLKGMSTPMESSLQSVPEPNQMTSTEVLPRIRAASTTTAGTPSGRSASTTIPLVPLPPPKEKKKRRVGAGANGANTTSPKSTKLSKRMDAVLTARVAQTDTGLALIHSSGAETERAGRNAMKSKGRSVQMQTQTQSARESFLKETTGMVSRMTSALTGKGEANPEYHIKQTFAIVCALRKEYDALKAVSMEKAQQLQNMEREVAYMMQNAKSMESVHTQYEHRLKKLEMQLDTVTIKINETEENRKNYELNIAHLKEEELDRFFQMEALRKQRDEIQALLRKMTEIKKQSQQEQENAAHEYEQFQEEIISFHQFATDQLRSFQHVFDILRSQRFERQRQRGQRETKAIERYTARISHLSSKVEKKDEQAKDLALELEKVSENVKYYQDRFQRIANATGLDTPEGIINKFYLKEEIKSDLVDEIAVKTQKLQSLQAERERVEAQLEAEKSNFSESRWRDVDRLQDEYRETQAKATGVKQQADRMMQRVALMQEGIVALIRSGMQVEGDVEEQREKLLKLEPNTQWGPKQFRSALRQFHEQIEHLKQRLPPNSFTAQGKVQVVPSPKSVGLRGIPYVPASVFEADLLHESALKSSGTVDDSEVLNKMEAMIESAVDLEGVEERPRRATKRVSHAILPSKSGKGKVK